MRGAGFLVLRTPRELEGVLGEVCPWAVGKDDKDMKRGRIH